MFNYFKKFFTEVQNQSLGFGAHESLILGNELQANVELATGKTPPPQLNISYPFPHYNQNSIGVCTAICLADALELMYGIPFSTQFIYNVGKKMIDGNISEGSSIKTMLRVVNTYGACPLSLITTDDTTQPYNQYVNAWFTPEQFAEAKKYRINFGTARLDPVGFAEDLANSVYGLLTRMAVGAEWYTDINGNICYSKSCLDPLRRPTPVTGGHAIKCIGYSGLDQNQYRTLRNTWGDKDNILKGNLPAFRVWGDNGDIHYTYNTLAHYVTEAWSISKLIPNLPVGYTWTRDLYLGVVGDDVKHLQMYLNNHGYTVAVSGAGSAGNETTYFGQLTKHAVMKLQAKNNINPVAGYFGPLTRAFVNTNQ